MPLDLLLLVVVVVVVVVVVRPDRRDCWVCRLRSCPELDSAFSVIPGLCFLRNLRYSKFRFGQTFDNQLQLPRKAQCSRSCVSVV